MTALFFSSIWDRMSTSSPTLTSVAALSASSSCFSASLQAAQTHGLITRSRRVVLLTPCYARFPLSKVIVAGCLTCQCIAQSRSSSFNKRQQTFIDETSQRTAFISGNTPHRCVGGHTQSSTPVVSGCCPRIVLDILQEFAIASQQLHALGVPVQHQLVGLVSQELHLINALEAVAQTLQGDLLTHQQAPEVTCGNQRSLVVHSKRPAAANMIQYASASVSDSCSACDTLGFQLVQLLLLLLTLDGSVDWVPSITRILHTLARWACSMVCLPEVLLELHIRHQIHALLPAAAGCCLLFVFLLSGED